MTCHSRISQLLDSTLFLGEGGEATLLPGGKGGAQHYVLAFCANDRLACRFKRPYVLRSGMRSQNQTTSTTCTSLSQTGAGWCLCFFGWRFYKQQACYKTTVPVGWTAFRQTHVYIYIYYRLVQVVLVVWFWLLIPERST